MRSGEASRVVGLARALALSWSAVALAGTAHLAAGGMAPGLAASLCVGAVLTIVGMPLCSSAFRLTRHGPMLLVQQLVTHVVLSQTSSGHGAPVRPTAQLAAAIDNGHAAHTSTAQMQHVGTSAEVAMSGHALTPSPTMALAHVIAALVVAALLSQAESDWTALRSVTHARARTAQSLRVLAAQFTAIPALSAFSALQRPLRPLRADAGSPPLTPLADLWRSPAPCRRGPPRPCAA